MHFRPFISLLVSIEESWTVNTGPLVTHRPATEPGCIQNTGSKAQILPGARGHYFPPDLALSLREGTQPHHRKTLSSLHSAWQVKWRRLVVPSVFTLNTSSMALIFWVFLLLLCWNGRFISFIIMLWLWVRITSTKVSKKVKVIFVVFTSWTNLCQLIVLEIVIGCMFWSEQPIWLWSQSL